MCDFLHWVCEKIKEQTAGEKKFCEKKRVTFRQNVTR